MLNPDPVFDGAPITYTADQFFAWGPDLSGRYQGAGGIGGLALYIDEMQSPGTRTFFPNYDGNGNVTALYRPVVSSTTPPETSSAKVILAAAYEYGPFGEMRSLEGPQGARNPFRWSTKFTDAESGMVYYGYRYYNPSTGRWLSRDPIGEEDDDALQRYLHNSPISHIDPLGLCTYCGPDVTQWLVNTINTHFKAPLVIRGQLTFTLVPSSPLGSLLMVPIYRDFYNFVKPGGPWDFKATEDFTSDLCPSRSCANTVGLCVLCFANDVPGNIHYGAVGARARIPERLLILAPGPFQPPPHFPFDDPLDSAAVNLGISLGMGNAPISKSALCSAVKRRSSSLNRSPSGCSPCPQSYAGHD